MNQLESQANISKSLSKINRIGGAYKISPEDLKGTDEYNRKYKINDAGTEKRMERTKKEAKNFLHEIETFCDARYLFGEGHHDLTCNGHCDE